MTASQLKAKKWAEIVECCPFFLFFIFIKFGGGVVFLCVCVVFTILLHSRMNEAALLCMNMWCEILHAGAICGEAPQCVMVMSKRGFWTPIDIHGIFKGRLLECCALADTSFIYISVSKLFSSLFPSLSLLWYHVWLCSLTVSFPLPWIPANSPPSNRSITDVL